MKVGFSSYGEICRFGFDWRGEFGSFYLFAQVMTGWDGKDIKDRKNILYGGFLGIDKICGFAEGFLLHPQERENFFEVNGDVFNGWAKIILGVDYAF